MFQFAALPLLVVFVLASFPSASWAEKIGLCNFDKQNLAFDGPPDKQATCLLRRVKPQGGGSVPQPIPDWLSTRVGQKIDTTPAALNKYLQAQNVGPDKVGGPVPESPDIGMRKYFVIHDTSSPEVEGESVTDFPADINEPTWDGNKLTGWKDTAKKVNAITNRIGDSRTFNDFKTDRPGNGTKLETAEVYPPSKIAFVHVENIQPRVKPADNWAHIAPDPGFAPAQLKRLALLYIVASVRSGAWLIPALHFNIDKNLKTKKGPHDDPQNFDLAGWVTAIENLVAEIGK